MPHVQPPKKKLTQNGALVTAPGQRGIASFFNSKSQNTQETEADSGDAADKEQAPQDVAPGPNADADPVADAGSDRPPSIATDETAGAGVEVSALDDEGEVAMEEEDDEVEGEGRAGPPKDRAADYRAMLAKDKKLDKIRKKVTGYTITYVCVFIGPMVPCWGGVCGIYLRLTVFFFGFHATGQQIWHA